MEAAALRNSAPPGRARTFFGYVWTVVGVAALASAVLLMSGPDRARHLPAAFWVMAALAVVCDARPFTPPGRRHSVAVLPSVCFTFAILLVWGFGPAVAVQTAAAMVSGVRLRHAGWRIVFNIGQYGCALAAAAVVLRLALPGGSFPGDAPPRWTDVPTVIAAAAAWFAVEYGSVTVALRLRFGGRWWPGVRRALPFELLAAASLLLLGPILAVAVQTRPALIPLVLVPLYAVYRMSRLSAEQERLALLDPLTGRANRKALVRAVTEQVSAHAEHAAAAQGRHQESGEPGLLALLLLDLDRFKHINDALGHAVGDRLLVEVGNRLATAIRPTDVLARLGGDEFAILAGGLRDVAQARTLADRIAAALREPVTLDGLPLDVDAAIGIACFPRHGLDFATLLRHADVAMYDAKHRGDTVAVYAPESDHNSPERLSLLADLRRVLEGAGEAGELALYYQPQIALDSGEVVGVEALLRWRHPRRGMVDPEELIRVAEQSAVMRLLTRRVVEDVTEQLAKWSAAGLQLRAAINVSVRDLHTGEIVDQVRERLARHDLPASRIQLEITEGALMADPRRVLSTIAQLDRLGVAIALDDFGTGYSSLQHLRRLPLAEVKIDRSFVLAMAADTDDAAIVRSVIELAGALGLRVVAEGVEDERTWRLLHAAGCRVAQGWFFARPMPAEDLVGWLSRYRPVRLSRVAESTGRHRLARTPTVPDAATPGRSPQSVPANNTSPAARPSPASRQPTTPNRPPATSASAQPPANVAPVSAVPADVAPTNTVPAPVSATPAAVNVPPPSVQGAACDLPPDPD